MTRQDEVDAVAIGSGQRLVRLMNDSLAGHARHAAALASRASNSAAPIDPVQELSIFTKRAARDAASFVRIFWTMLEAMAYVPEPIGDPGDDPAPESNPIGLTVGPASIRGPCHPADWRRRGEGSPRVPTPPITATRDPNDPSQVDLCIEAGGLPRGLYEGTVRVGTGSSRGTIPYNVYVDWLSPGSVP